MNTLTPARIRLLTILLLTLSAPSSWDIGPRRRLRDDHGQSTTEYVLIAGGIALVAVAAVAIIRTWVLNEAGSLPSSG